MGFDSLENLEGKENEELKKNLEKKGIIGEFTEQELTNIGDLGINFKKEGDIDSKDIDTKISTRFNKEIQKAGISGDAPGLKELKQGFEKEIQGAKNMEEKLKLYSAFMEELKGNVGTTIAEEMRNQKDYQKILKTQVGENQKSLQNNFDAIRKIAQELKEMKNNTDKKRIEAEQKQGEKASNLGNKDQKDNPQVAGEFISKRWPV